MPLREPQEEFVGSSIQFRINCRDDNQIIKFLKACNKRGVQLKWFGDKDPKAYTSRYDSWTYIENLPVLPRTLNVLRNTIDMRIPLTFNKDDCDLITKIIAEEITANIF